MEITDVIDKKTIEAFEVFYLTVEDANKKVLSVAIKDICKELEEKYFHLDSVLKKQRFHQEFISVKEKLNKECTIILNAWFDEYILTEF